MSSIPAAVDALIAVVRARLPALQVLDGAPVEELDKDTIVIGWASDRAAVTAVTEREGLSPDDLETYQIVNLISCTQGDTDIKTLRDRAFGYYTTIASELRRDPKLGGAVMSAQPAVAEVDQVQTEDGSSVDITFTIECEAYG